MYRYFDDSETPKDKDYQKIMEQLDGFMEQLPSEEDRQLLSRMVSECYYKYGKSIKSMEKDDPSLITQLIMALIVNQNSMIERLKDSKG
ncbi:MAG: hypothetical protein M3M88_01400 [Thermoproteota archaeon]|nr:hypothetical protein [Thermoproteota archaeon]